MVKGKKSPRPPYALEVLAKAGYIPNPVIYLNLTTKNLPLNFSGWVRSKPVVGFWVWEGRGVDKHIQTSLQFLASK